MTALTAQQKEALVKLLIEGLKKSDPAMVRGCMERGCDPLVQATEPGKNTWRAGMHWAMVHFSEKCADEIFTNGISVNAKDNAGETPLFTAIRQSKPEAVEYLMKKGANPIAQNNNGNVASDLAIGLPADSNWSREIRDRILKALAGPVLGENGAVAAQFDAAAGKDVKVMKTITLQKSDEPSNDDNAPASGKGPGFKL
jgi:hypothetical protein